MYKVRFSIVIPTRERPETLEYCLDTCINQEKFHNYEIIVSDNSRSTTTKDLIESLNCEKIKYFATGGNLAMHENFEFAVSQATGEYVMFLGDDDGLLLKSLYHLDEIISKTGFKAIAWQWIFYYWPHGVPVGVENLMYIPISSNIKIVNGKESIKEVIRFQKPYNRLPMLYINAVIHNDLISELRVKAGGVFGSITPDCYSAFCFAYLSNHYLFLDRPFTIAGISGKSNGNNHLYKKWDNEVSNDYSSLNNKSSVVYHKQVPFVRSLNALVSEAFVQAKERLFINDEELFLTRKSILSNTLKDIVLFEQQEWIVMLGTIKKSIEDDKDLVKWFDSLLRDFKPTFKDITQKQDVKTGVNADMLVINGASFECRNVKDVATFYNKFLDSEIDVPDYIKVEATQYKPPHKATLIRRVLGRVKRASRVLIRGN